MWVRVPPSAPTTYLFELTDRYEINQRWLVFFYCKKGMKKQVGKSHVFTKTSLSQIQDKMRNACIKSYNKFYEVDTRLKEKEKGRNQDINVKDMGNYRKFKKQLKIKEQKLEKANTKTKQLDNSSNEILTILDSLKPTLMNKNNMSISSENVQIFKNYINDVRDVTKTIRIVNDLNVEMKELQHKAFKTEQENNSLKYELELKDDEIKGLKNELSTKEKVIIKLKEEKEIIKGQLHKFKNFWHNLMSHFQKKINYYKDENYKIVSDDLYKNGIFDDNDYEIATNELRKVTIPDKNMLDKNKKKNNDTRF